MTTEGKEDKVTICLILVLAIGVLSFSGCSPCLQSQLWGKWNPSMFEIVDTLTLADPVITKFNGRICLTTSNVICDFKRIKRNYRSNNDVFLYENDGEMILRIFNEFAPDSMIFKYLDIPTTRYSWDTTYTECNGVRFRKVLGDETVRKFIVVNSHPCVYNALIPMDLRVKRVSGCCGRRVKLLFPLPHDAEGVK